MKSQIHQLIAASGLLLATIAGTTHAQEQLPFGPANYESDMQLFAPVELDLDAAPFSDDYGYYGQYDACYWSYSGERVTIGNPDVLVLAEEIYRQNGIDLGTRPDPYVIENGLQDVTPDAGFAFGDRYEIGYRDKGNGWKIGILDGPELVQNQFHGMSDALQGDSLPKTPPIDPSYVGPVSGDGLYALGFGNVHVNFETPEGYLQGFRDYLNFAAGAALGTQVGPLAYVGNYGALLEADLDDEDVNITFFRLADDINENGIPGAIPIVVPHPTIPGAFLVSTLTDFDDLHTFNVAFDAMLVRNFTETDGIEAMWTHELTNRHYQAKHQNNRLEVSYGARYFKMNDLFTWDANGGILGRSYQQTSFENQIVGPQIGAKWTNQRQRWTISADTRFTFGYNVQDWDQFGGIGEELVPGALNRLLFAQPTYFNRGLQQEEFSPLGELRVDAAYYLTQSLKLKVGYTGMFVGGIRRAATSVRYRLPDLGYREAGTQDLIVNGVNFGVELCY